MSAIRKRMFDMRLKNIDRIVVYSPTSNFSIHVDTRGIVSNCEKLILKKIIVVINDYFKFRHIEKKKTARNN